MTGRWTAAAACGCSDMKKRLKRLLPLALGIVLYVFGILCCQKAGRGMGLTELKLSQGIGAKGVSEITGNEAQEDAPIRFCFRGRGDQETVTGELTGTSRQVEVLYLAGNPELMGCGGLAWEKGCVVDEGTARALFGTEICAGQTLLWRGEAYPVLGTASGSQARLLVMAREEDGDMLDSCLLEGAGEAAEGFLLRHGLEGKKLDLLPFWALTRDLLLLTPCLALVTLAVRLGRGFRTLCRKRLRRQWKLLANAALSLGLLGAALWLVRVYGVIPADMIPSRWSDFSFWDAWREAQRANISALRSAAPWEERLQMTENMVKSMGSALGSTLLILWAIREEHHADTAD